MTGNKQRTAAPRLAQNAASASPYAAAAATSTRGPRRRGGRQRPLHRPAASRAVAPARCLCRRRSVKIVKPSQSDLAALHQPAAHPLPPHANNRTPQPSRNGDASSNGQTPQLRWILPGVGPAAPSVVAFVPRAARQPYSAGPYIVRRQAKPGPAAVRDPAGGVQDM